VSGAIPDKPEDEYGEWTRGNAGQVGRTVTRWYQGITGEWMPIVDWETHPDETQSKHADSDASRSRP
jgi:hypothetical protein